MPLKIIVVKKQEGVFIVSPIGEIDSTTYAELEEKLAPILVPATKVLVFNMEGVNYISSMGISAILKSNKTIGEQGNIFLMTNLQPQIKMAFEIIKALPEIQVFRNLEEVDNYLIEMQRREIKKQKGSPEA